MLRRSRSSLEAKPTESKYSMELKPRNILLTTHSWLDKAAKGVCESDEEYRTCPSADCSWACFFSTKENGNIFTCQMCKYRYCVTCEAPMHEGETCEEFQNTTARKAEQVQQNAASEKRLGEISKPCPKCTMRLDKYTGCDHVTCTPLSYMSYLAMILTPLSARYTM